MNSAETVSACGCRAPLLVSHPTQGPCLWRRSVPGSCRGVWATSVRDSVRSRNSLPPRRLNRGGCRSAHRHNVVGDTGWVRKGRAPLPATSYLASVLWEQRRHFEPPYFCIAALTLQGWRQWGRAEVVFGETWRGVHPEYSRRRRRCCCCCPPSCLTMEAQGRWVRHPLVLLRCRRRQLHRRRLRQHKSGPWRVAGGGATAGGDSGGTRAVALRTGGCLQRNRCRHGIGGVHPARRGAPPVTPRRDLSRNTVAPPPRLPLRLPRPSPHSHTSSPYCC